MESRTQSAGRLLTGSSGLDELLHGGLLRDHLYLVIGPAGAGKTILTNQICYAAATRGGCAVYVSMLSESNVRLIQQMTPFAFFKREHAGTNVRYYGGYDTFRTDGFAGLRRLFVTECTHERRPEVIVLDGVHLLAETAPSPWE